MTRREALALLSTLPLGARAIGQVRPSPRHRVILGGTHSYLLGPDGTMQVWYPGRSGDRAAPDYLGLGHNQPIDPYTLYPVPGLTNVVDAVVSAGFAFAVRSDGQLLAWGDNANGMLGTTPRSVVEQTASWGPSSNRPIPTAVRFDAVGVSSRSEHVLAIARDGHVWAWGKGELGQLGIGPMPIINFKTHTPGPMAFVPFPVLVPNLDGVVAVSAGHSFSLALLGDGSVRAWGLNTYGQLGDGTKEGRDRPVTVKGVRNAVAIAAGALFAIALLADGTVVRWGTRDNGATLDLEARPVPGVRGAKAIVAGLTHAAALTDAGTVITFGDDRVHQLGRGWPAVPPGPGAAAVSGLTGVQSIAAHTNSTAAVLSSGRIMTWGGVRPWTRPNGDSSLSDRPILLWVDGLDQP